jgi:two-component system phosphate regulon sensor histidine kinase PhoR
VSGQTELEIFARELENLRQRLLSGDDEYELPILAEETLTALQTSLEELRVAQEELAAQADQLSAVSAAASAEAARYAELFDGAPDAYLVTDENGLVGEANRAAETFFRASSATLRRKPLIQFLDLAQRRELRTTLNTLRRTAVRTEFEIRMRRRDGVSFDASVAVSPMGSREEDRRLLWLIRDVTETRQLEQRLWELNAELESRVAQRTGSVEAERARLRVVLEHLPVAMLLADADGNVVLENAQARAILDGRDWANVEFMDESGRRLARRDRPLTRALEHGAVALHRRMHVDVDGRRMTLDVSAVPIFTADGRQEGALTLWEDITTRERRERAEREFIANAAHELRTPLAAIAAAVEVLQSGAKDLPEERDRFLAHIERQCERLERAGRALLTLARAEASQEAPRVALVRLRPLLEELALDLRPPKTIDLRVECPDSAATVTNVELLRQALWNLASNALRYTAQGEVRLEVEKFEDERLAILVRDTGPGIPRADLERLFEPFFRGARPDADGYGLGLGIARRSLAAVGASLELSSDENGTVARIVVPAARVLTGVGT